MKKIETIAEFQQLAKRTCNDLGTLELNIFHMQSGIITEIGEAIDPIKKHIAYGKHLDLVNVGEEIADICWYIVNRALFMLTPEQNSIGYNDNLYKEEISLSKDFFSGLFTDKDPTETLMIICQLINGSTVMPNMCLDKCTLKEAIGISDLIVLNFIAEKLGLDFWQILTNNIQKLVVRYPDKYTDVGALNRDLDAERKALEK